MNFTQWCNITSVLASALWLFSITATAQLTSGGDGGFRNVAAHTHGTVTMTLIVVDGDRIVVGLESPAINLVGFESEPGNPQQHQAVENAIALLSQLENVMTLPGGACKLVDIKSEVHGFSAYEESHEHEEHEHNEGGHAEFLANYILECAEIAAVRDVSVTLFKTFPNVENVEVLWATDAGQGATSVVPSRAEFRLRL